LRSIAADGAPEGGQDDWQRIATGRQGKPGQGDAGNDGRLAAGFGQPIR
jgi:hypothetical protein